MRKTMTTVTSQLLTEGHVNKQSISIFYLDSDGYHRLLLD